MATEFFRHLVFFNQAINHSEQMLHYKQLCHFRAFREVRPIRHGLYRYPSRWHYPVIRELTLIPSCKEDPEWIVERLDGMIEKTEAAEAAIPENWH